MTDLFDGTFDILAGNLIPKPYPESYQLFSAKFGIDPSRTAFFDDLAVNLDVPEQLGMAAIWVNGEPGPGPTPYELIGRRRRVWDLAGYLRSVRDVVGDK